MDDYIYSGPRVRRTPQSVAAVTWRANRLIEAETQRRYEAAKQQWATESTGSFPDVEAIAASVTADLETVCRALDGWAAVDPETVFGPEWRWDHPQW